MYKKKFALTKNKSFAYFLNRIRTMTWKKFLLSSAVLYLFLFDDIHVLARTSFHEGQTGGKKYFSKIIGGEQPDPGSPNANDVPSQDPIVCENGTKLKVEIQFDGFPNETSWDLVNVCDDNKEVASGEGVYGDDYGKLRIYNKCLTRKTKYKFTIYDSKRDGFCGNDYREFAYCYGNYTVAYGVKEDNVVADGNGDFGYSSSHEFGMPGQSDCTKPKCSSVGYHFHLRKTFCKGRANSSNSKFARHWKIKDGEKEDVLNTRCKFKPCKKSDCCEKGGQRKCTNTGNKGFVQGGFTQDMCGKFKKLKTKKELKDSPCTGQDGFKCTKKDCCNVI